MSRRVQADDESFLGFVSSVPKIRTFGELATSQCGVIAFIARPVFKLWDGIFGGEAYMHALTSHLAYWKTVGEMRTRLRLCVLVFLCYPRRLQARMPLRL